MKKLVFLLFACMLFFASNAFAEKSCGIYFTKIGCPVCASVDPVLLGNWIKNREDTVIIEYVFTSWTEENATLMGEYNLSYATGGSVPLVIKSTEVNWSGIPAFADADYIYGMLETTFPAGEGNVCLLPEKSVFFEDLDLNELPKTPKILHGKRLLVKKGTGNVSSDFLKELLMADNLKEVLAGSNYVLKELKAEPVQYSGGELPIAQAIEIEGAWILKLRDKIELPENVLPIDPNDGNGNGNEENPFILPFAIILICLAALIMFIKVKSK